MGDTPFRAEDGAQPPKCPLNKAPLTPCESGAGPKSGGHWQWECTGCGFATTDAEAKELGLYD